MRQTILIVDDVKANITVLAGLIKDEWDVKIATNGESALRICSADPKPDLVLLDVMMPDIDGYEVCRKLKENSVTRDIPIIFVTAMIEDEDEERGLTLGAIDYITKPFRPAIVKARIRNHLELKSYRDHLRQISMFDGLTGIPNRRRFEEAISVEWKRCARVGSSLAVIMIDIDNFKRYNDTYGHLEGDECLRKVASGICEGLKRPADLAARWGGEEFVCLLPDTDSDAAFIIAEKIRNIIVDLDIPHQASVNSNIVTISLGVTAIIPKDGVNFADLMETADRGLYNSKNSGKNRVTIEMMK